MGKNWLIRTKTNHILGPISKEKVLELLQNGSIKADDEVCSGNGFWFYIREDEMVARFLLGREQQSFNPISEAKDVLTSQPKNQFDDDDITMVGGIDLKRLNEKTPPAGTYVSPLPFQDVKPPSTPDPKKKSEVDRSKGKNQAVPAPRIVKERAPKAPLKKQNYLQYLVLICFLGLLAALFYRKAIFRYFKSADLALVSTAYAQVESSAEKKK
jgi:hypothetical protein